ncbi:MAG: hypothetical protein ACNI27_03295 [Desulfovibrio sp.]
MNLSLSFLPKDQNQKANQWQMSLGKMTIANKSNSAKTSTNEKYTSDVEIRSVDKVELSERAIEVNEAHKTNSAAQKNTSPNAQLIPPSAIPGSGTPLKTRLNMWEEKFGIKEGVTILDNGNKQIVTIEDGKMELFELSNERIVRHDTGTIDSGNISKRSDTFDANGNLLKSVQSELSSYHFPEPSNATGAILTRNIQWFEKGELVKNMDDQMNVQASFKDLNEFATGEERIKHNATKDSITSNYKAVVSEYNNGLLFQRTQLTQGVKSTFITNRGTEDFLGLEPGEVKEKGQSNTFSVSVSNFNQQGELIHSSSLEEYRTKGSVKQEFSESWYNNGNILRSREGSLLLRADKGKEVPGSQSLFDQLDISKQDFSQKKPLTAEEMLTENYEENTSATTSLLSASINETNDGAHGFAGNLDEYDQKGFTYSLEMRDTFYNVEGQIEGQVTHTEEQEENFRPPKGFALARGLTEDKTPGTLKKTTHTVQEFENMNQTYFARSQFKELIEEDKDEIGHVETQSSTTKEDEKGSPKVHSTDQVAANIKETDPNAVQASQLLGSSIQMNLNDFLSAFQRTHSMDQRKPYDIRV